MYKNKISHPYYMLKPLTDAEILNILAESWGVKDTNFEVWGELLPLTKKNFSFLKNVRLIKTGQKIYYPLAGKENEACQVFVNSKDAKKLQHNSEPYLIRCTLELSPQHERDKHENPLLLCMKQGSGSRLESLPNIVPEEILTKPYHNGEISQFIEESIYNFYFEKAKNTIDEKIKEKEDKFNKKIEKKENELNEKIKKEEDNLDKKIQKTQKLEDEINKKIKEKEIKQNNIEEIIINLNKKQENIEHDINLLYQEKTIKEQEIKELIQKYKRAEILMNYKIKKLKKYIEKRALFLKTFEFIDEEELDLFLQESKPQRQTKNGISFNESMEGDYSKAVSYIQAYLINNDILYPRHIIENYLTLLRTRDLIILAGDSGSGKTHLVKSFAKAVGGKSIVIPVKPNWTSSEDLLGYYNPLEKKYLATPFLEALLEAQKNPETPYFICLDEMNLARVEYYFADFLSLLETRDDDPEIILYADNESSHVLSELKAVVEIIQTSKEKYKQDGVINFIELLKDEELNNQIRMAFGFSDKDSLIKYHSEVRRMLSAVISMPSSIKMPSNVYIIGAINIDETTHYLSPKILDRAHIMRFKSPLLSNWDEILQQVEDYNFEDLSKPLLFDINELGYRHNYPKFDREHPFCKLFIELNKEFFHNFGIEFGMRTIRQGLNYLRLFNDVNKDDEMAINNFLLHKILPKLTFDGNKIATDNHTKLELLEQGFIHRVKEILPNYESYNDTFSTIYALEKIVKDAKINDGIVNFWS